MPIGLLTAFYRAERSKIQDLLFRISRGVFFGKIPRAGAMLESHQSSMIIKQKAIFDNTAGVVAMKVRPSC
jgi:hypothetical protein